MEIKFHLEEHEKRVTPLKMAEALVEQKEFTRDELKELIEYLSVYTRYHMED